MDKSKVTLVNKDGSPSASTLHRVKRLVDIKTLVETLEQEEKDIKAILQKQFEDEGLQKIETDMADVTYIAETKKVAFDSKTFKEAHPELFNEFQKESKVSANIRVKIK